VKALLASFALVALALSPTPAQAQSPAFVTLSFGRMQWVPTLKCVPLPGGVDLGSVADALQARGDVATGIVITDRTQETTRKCFLGYALQASWADIAGLADRGWSFVSGGTHAQDISSLPPSEQYAETCGSLQAFADHGLDASGMFAWANNVYDDTVQRTMVATCFDWGRRYSKRLNTPAINQAPYVQRTWSLTGGSCAAGTGSCSTYPPTVGAHSVYQPPSVFASYLAGSPDTWAVLQAYRLVKGSNLSGNLQWDCSASNPAQHWTNRGEMYCYRDYLTIVDSVPASSVITDPAGVAAAWGRTI
jgi:hypothetical protein